MNWGGQTKVCGALNLIHQFFVFEIEIEVIIGAARRERDFTLRFQLLGALQGLVGAHCHMAYDEIGHAQTAFDLGDLLPTAFEVNEGIDALVEFPDAVSEFAASPIVYFGDFAAAIGDDLFDLGIEFGEVIVGGIRRRDECDFVCSQRYYSLWMLLKQPGAPSSPSKEMKKTRGQGDKEKRGQGENYLSPCLPLSLSPCLLVPLSSIILRHRVSDAYCQNSFDRVSRQRHHLGERVTVFFRDFRQDEIRRVIYGMVGGDAQTQPRKILPSQFLNDRLQPFLAARAPSGANANLAEGQRQVVADDEDRRALPDLVLVDQRGDGDSAQVHEGLRLDQQNFLLADCRAGGQSLTLGGFNLFPRAARQLIDDHETAVVARPLVFRAGIA